MKIFCSLILLIVLIDQVLTHSIPDGYELEQIHALIRHGDRIPDKEEIYLTDPYEDLFNDLGNGQLTNVGKQRAYQVGTLLREYYNDFIGEYRYNNVYAFSTDFDRTKTSLQLVLAGLYPPIGRNVWNCHINWSPVPTYYDYIDDNIMMNFYCPNFVKMLQEAFNSPEVQSVLEGDADFHEYIFNHTGVSTEIPNAFGLLYENIRSVKGLNLALPDWCTDDVYTKLEKTTALVLSIMTFNQQMTKIIVGPIIEKFLLNLKSNGSVPEQKRKIQLYCGHDINVATFCHSHNFTDVPEIPDYGSTIVIEKLFGPNNQTYLRFFLWTGSLETWIPLKLENCAETCPLSIYESMVESMLPDETTRHCTSSGTYCEHIKTALKIDLPNR